MRSCPDHRAFTRPSCVHVQTIVRSCPDHRAFIRVSRPCNFERTTPPSCVHFGLDISGFGLGPHPGTRTHAAQILISFVSNHILPVSHLLLTRKKSTTLSFCAIFRHCCFTLIYSSLTQMSKSFCVTPKDTSR